MKSTPKTTPSSHQKRKFFFAIVFIITMVVGGYLLYRHEQSDKAIATERAQYSQAEKDMDALAAQIVAKFGQPIKNTKDKSCGYTSNPNEFKRGDLYCGITVILYYEVTDRSSADSLEQQISTAIKEGNSFKVGATSDALAHNSSPPPTELLSMDIQDKTMLDCSADYTYFTNENGSQGYPDFPSVTTGGLQVRLSCGSRSAKAVYFPLTQG